MTIPSKAVLLTAMLLGNLAVPYAHAQRAVATDAQQQHKATLTGVIDEINATSRQLIIGGVVYRVQPLTTIVDSLGREQRDIRSLESGMLIEFSGEVPTRPDDTGTIRAIRIIPN